MSRKSRALPPSPFYRFNSSPELIRLVLLMYVRFLLSLRIVEDLMFERGIDICHEAVRPGGTGSVAVRRRHPVPAGEQHPGLSSLALTPGRDVREAERRDGLPRASS